MINQQTVHRIVKKTEKTEQGEVELTYVLTETHGIGAFGSVYSVTVSIRKGSYVEEQTAYDVSRKKEKAVEIFELLYRNTVTPCTLIDVLTDIL